MSALLFRLTGAFAALGLACFAAEKPAAETGTSDHIKEAIRERLAEDASLAPAPAAPSAQTNSPATPGPAPEPAVPPSSAQATPPASSAQTPPPGESPTVLPKVEVQRSRITDVDRQLHEKDKEIAREKALTKATEADKALNGPKAAKAFSLFGGVSSSDRARVASERVELLEAEKDLLEQIKLAKTKEEKQELQKEIDDLKALRRDLEKGLR